MCRPSRPMSSSTWFRKGSRPSSRSARRRRCSSRRPARSACASRTDSPPRRSGRSRRSPRSRFTPDGGQWQIPTTDAVAHVEVDIRSLFDGKTQPLAEGRALPTHRDDRDPARRIRVDPDRLPRRARRRLTGSGVGLSGFRAGRAPRGRRAWRCTPRARRLPCGRHAGLRGAAAWCRCGSTGSRP